MYMYIFIYFVYFVYLFILQQLNQNDQTNIPVDLRVSLEPYMMEAGIDFEHLCLDLRMVIQGLVRYFIINKRKLELDDIAKLNVVKY